MYNQLKATPSYKYFYGTFKKDIFDFHFGKKTLDCLDEKSVIQPCINNFDYKLRYDDYVHNFKTLKKYLKFFGYNSRFEFEEKVLNPIIMNLSSKYGQEFEKIQRKISESISYEENFN